MITSNKNAQIKFIRKLLSSSKERKKERLYVVEGIRMFREIPKEMVFRVFVTEEFEKNHKELLDGTNYETMTDSVMKEISDTITPQGVLALVKIPDYKIEDVLTERCSLLLLENIQDPGNLGTIMRTAEATGMNGILMTEDTVDLFNPKTVRATMGAIFRVPFVIIRDKKETIALLHKKKITTFAAHLDGTDCYEYDFTGSSCFFIGNEGNGLTKELTDMAEKKIKIPMCGKVESLNASIAATVLMYEVLRQRYK